MPNSLPQKKFTYVVGQLSSVALYKVRFMIGDTDVSDVQLDDEEIAYLLSASGGNITRAAVAACYALVARYSRLVDSAVSDVRFSYTQRVEHYRMLAAQIAGGAWLGGNEAAGLPYSGGISIADMETVQSDTDRPEPEFAVGMHDFEDTSGVIGR